MTLATATREPSVRGAPPILAAKGGTGRAGALAELCPCGVARTDDLKHAAGRHDADEAGQYDLRPRPGDGVMRAQLKFRRWRVAMNNSIASGPSSTSPPPPTAIRGEERVERRNN